MSVQPYFCLSGITPVAKLTPGAAVHVIGVCGVAMAQAAVLLSELGFRVSGSDKEFYEPMGGLLARSSIRLLRGYDSQNIPQDAALVVIGNAVSYGHPEVSAVEQRQLPYTIFPQLLHDLVIQGKHSVVIVGTHGKTTTTSLLSATLQRLGAQPGYFVGGIANDLSSSLSVGKGQISVVEGDEYDSAFFAKVPKFNFYRPQTLIVTSVEFDHADIYPDLAAVVKQFDRLVRSMPDSGCVVCCIDDANVATLARTWQRDCRCRIRTYGTSTEAQIQIVNRTQEGLHQRVRVAWSADRKSDFLLPLPGGYNAANALAALLVCEDLGFDGEACRQALAQFSGVRRRQELRYSGGVDLIEDFAHHPTAVRETVDAIRQWYPGRRLWAVFEPRSNTSRRKVFQEQYVQAFHKADQVLLCQVEARAVDQDLQLLDVGELAQAISLQGPPARSLENADAIFSTLTSELCMGDVILIMSNGSFGGLPLRLEQHLKNRAF